MKTIEFSQEDMTRRIARFSDLQPISNQQDTSIPQSAKDLIYARKLLPVIGLEGTEETPLSDSAPIKGAAGMTMTMAVCPPGQGPGLHAHRRTFETFTVLKGSFEFTWGDSGENSVVLDQCDTISLPPAVCRAFRNVSENEGILQVIITGGVHDMNDVDVPPVVKYELDSIAPEFRQKLKKSGITFTAGIEDSE